eukprot:CAMPEP_0203636948 /NCGR_PEP_ID=MMETSP0088-20131115/3377_1 /ASSEMBLY_ACC=CAM_ASM_001087 /TAXON_ID=426623 /ORGANISM="Chaetoceros affinis, Strain CCMP159" /LENGTH=46 /DNA_ID= /DNA_START= /DNA_END= /DNA_ORIENTATION=
MPRNDHGLIMWNGIEITYSCITAEKKKTAIIAPVLFIPSLMIGKYR